MKTLIILAHPNIANSFVNRHWRDAVLAHPDKFEIHDLYALYADFKIDVEKEQKLLESHDKIVLQFPFRFSNCTPLLKQWFEDVFTRGWAYGTESGGKLKGKKFALAISLGATEANYSKNGIVGFSVDEVLAPFKATFNFVGATTMPNFVSYGFTYDKSEQAVENSAKSYIKYLNQL